MNNDGDDVLNVNGRAPILVVDDDEVHRYATRRTLETVGFLVEEATSGEEALKRLGLSRPQGERGGQATEAVPTPLPWLVVLDVRLPGVDGYEVCRRIKSSPDTESVLVLHLSAHLTATQDQVVGLEAGADVYLTIPVDPGVLVAQVRSLRRIADSEQACRQNEEAMRSSEDQLRLMVEGARDHAMLLLDLQGCITRWNSGAENILGWSETEVRGEYASFIFTPEDRAAGVPELEMEIARTKGKAEDVRWHMKKDGSRFFADGAMTALYDEESNTLRGFGKVMRDVTGRRRTEEALQESEERFRLMADAVPQIVWITDPEGRVEFFNRQWTAYTGAPYEPTTAAEVAVNHVHPEDAIATMKAFNEARQTGETFLIEHRLRSSGGKYRWFLVRGEPYRDPRTGDILRWFGASLDIHDRKQAEHAQAEASAKQERIAEMLQRSLLLQPERDAFPGVEVHTEYQAAWSESMVGGDFADVYALDEDNVALVVGDVTGKGLLAATYTAEVKFALRAFLRESPNPARAMYRLNHYLAMGHRFDREPQPDRFVALCLAVVNTLTGEVQCSAAGSEPPILVSRSPDSALPTASEVAITGPILGMEEDSEFGLESVHLAPGDLLVMATDGITEARRGREREFFGSEGLAQAAVESVPLPSLEAAGRAIVATALAFAGGMQRDDICLLLAKRTAKRTEHKEHTP